MRSFTPRLIRGRNVIIVQQEIVNDTNNEINDQVAVEWVDLRRFPIEFLGLEVTIGTEIFQNTERGLWAGGTGSFFGRGVKFGRFPWSRGSNLSFSFVFNVRSVNTSFLFGIGSEAINVNNLGSQALFAGEIQFFYDNGRFQRLIGGGGESNWEQNIGATVIFEEDNFYKVTFENSGQIASNVTITRVDQDDFNYEIENLGSFEVIDNPAEGRNLVPYWNAINTPEVFITAITNNNLDG